MADAKQTQAQLMPFNEEQFDRCALWLARRLGRSVTQYDLLKFHVMTDIYHVLACGRPVIGGKLEKWKYGPVVSRAWHRLDYQTRCYEMGRDEGVLSVQAREGNAYRFAARPGAKVDQDDFSKTEIDAMEAALKVVRMGFAKSQTFFHKPRGSFVGKAWHDTQDGCPIDWNLIIDAYDSQHGTDHSHIKTLIALGV